MNTTPAEEWRTIPEYGDRYEASTLGRIRSLDRMVTGSRPGRLRRQPGRVLKPKICKGYLAVGPFDNDGIQRNRYVHTLVCIAFHGPRPEGHQVRHLNGDNRDNRPENLAWGTASENMRDRVRHGTDPGTRRTACPARHEYNQENTYYTKDGHRHCRACHRIREAAVRSRSAAL